MQMREAALHVPLVEAFDELNSTELQQGPTNRAQQLDLAAMKVLTSGKPPCNCVLVACNPCNLPCLQKLCTCDPAAYNRLAFLPARSLEGAKAPNIYGIVEALAPAFTHLLFNEFLRYSEQGLLPQPSPMLQHRDLLLRYSTRAAFRPCHMAFVETWLNQQVQIGGSGSMPASGLTDKFVGCCMTEVLAMGKHYQRQGSLEPPSVIAARLLDAVLASHGVELLAGGSYARVKLLMVARDQTTAQYPGQGSRP
jgi:hypothetical protein